MPRPQTIQEYAETIAFQVFAKHGGSLGVITASMLIGFRAVVVDTLKRRMKPKHFELLGTDPHGYVDPFVRKYIHDDP